MTLADIAYYPFLERIAATIKPYKVTGPFLPRPSCGRSFGGGWSALW